MTARLFPALRGLLCLGFFVAAFCGGCWSIREALPFPEVLAVKQKLEQFAAHHDDYDALFLGSSRIYYQIIPALFDRLAAQQGLPTRSFNAAVAGMRPPEDAYYFDYLLRSKPKNLRWVFIELAGLRTAVDPDKVGTLRAVYWHDWERLWLLWKRALEVKPDIKKRKWKKQIEPRLEQIADFWDHMPIFVQNQTNLGRASIFTAKLISTVPPLPVNPRGYLGEDLAGWTHTGRAEVMTGPELADFEKALAERRLEKPRREPGDAVSQEALEAMIARVEKLGATPVLIVPPTTNKRNFVASPEREGKSIVLDFCDLEKFPELYEHRYRLDTDHLNTEGARVFTRIFVDAWAAEVKRRQ